MQSNTQTRIVYSGSESLTPGANLGFAHNILNLLNVGENLVDDGKVPQIKSIRIHFRARCDTTTINFSLLPVVVQTAGTFTDTVNLSVREVSDMLNAAIDDEFGYDLCGQRLRVSKHHGTGTMLSYQRIDFAFDIPRHLINLINKQVSTERLQEIYLGFVGFADNSNSIVVQSYREVKFIEKSKGITIR